MRTYTEAVQWFAAAHLIPRTACTRWDQVEGHDVRRWMVYLTGRCAGQTWSASPGELVFLPRDTEHSFIVTSRYDAKILVVVGPPHFDAHVAQRGIPSL